MNLNQLTDEKLIERTEDVIRTERANTAEVIRLFHEISDRKLYLIYAYPNLYEMATKHFGYCAGSAMRRINAMRLTRAVPAAQAKIESGELSLSVASELQSFFYAEAKDDRAYLASAKQDLLTECLGKSRRDVEKELTRLNSEREKRESIRYVSNDRLRLSISISEELNQKLQRLRDLLSHVDPNLSTEQLIDRLAEYGVDRHDPVRKAERADLRRK